MKSYRLHDDISFPSLESDILKVRAFEMVLVLFYMEDLKHFVINSIESSDIIFKNKSRLKNESGAVGGCNKIKLAWKLLVSEGVISQAESDEIKGLLDYRNIIGHQVHRLTVDVGSYSSLMRRDPNTFEPISDYDYTAAKRARSLRKKVGDGMRRKFALAVSFSSLRFKVAENVYISEIERLSNRINKGIDRANNLIDKVNEIICSIPKKEMEAAQPGHPRNIKGNGALTKQGVACIFRLYKSQATPFAAAYLMHISLRSAKYWYGKWRAQGEC